MRKPNPLPLQYPARSYRRRQHKMTKKTVKSCEKCGSQNVRTHPTIYPVQTPERQIDIGKVWVRECFDCGVLIPTKAGQEKIERTMGAFISFISSK